MEKTQMFKWLCKIDDDLMKAISFKNRNKCVLEIMRARAKIEILLNREVALNNPPLSFNS